MTPPCQEKPHVLFSHTAIAPFSLGTSELRLAFDGLEHNHFVAHSLFQLALPRLSLPLLDAEANFDLARLVLVHQSLELCPVLPQSGDVCFEVAMSREEDEDGTYLSVNAKMSGAKREEIGVAGCCYFMRRYGVALPILEKKLSAPLFAPVDFQRTEPISLSAARLADYVAASGEMHPLYHSLAYARSQGFHDVLVPPHFFMACLPSLMGGARAVQHLRIAFHQHIFAGDALTLHATSKDAPARAVLKRGETCVLSAIFVPHS